MPKVKHAEDRLKRLDQLISKRKNPLNTKDLLAMLNTGKESPISKSSLDKDIRELRNRVEEDGIILDFSVAKGYHYSKEGYSYFNKELNEDDSKLLELAKTLFGLFSGTGLDKDFNEVVGKIRDKKQGRGDQAEVQINNLIEMQYAVPEKTQRWIRKIFESIISRETLKIRYRPFGKEMKEKYISPYLLKQHETRWYMVAYDHTSTREAKTNVFSLENIEDVDVSNKAYVQDPGFNASDYFRYSLGIWHWHNQEPIIVVLEFTNYMDFVKKYPLHHSQKIINDSPQKLLVSLQVYDSPELHRLILSFGAGVKVLEPAILAEKISSEAQTMLELYKSGK